MSRKPLGTKRFRFTEKSINALPPHDPNSRSKCTEYSDLEVKGLKISVTSTGTKTYYMRWQRDKRKYAVRIGQHGPLSVSDARKKAIGILAEVENGGNPAEERLARKSVPTLQAFCELEFLPHIYQHKRTAKGDEAMLHYRILPLLGNLQLDRITRQTIQQFLDNLRKKRTPATCNRHLSLLHRLFNLAKQWGRVEKNPATGIPKFKENNKRERFITNDELNRLEEKMKGHSHQMGMQLFRFLLLTGVRLGEAQKAEWKHIDLKGSRWWLPETKAGGGRTVVLNDGAVALLRTLPRHENSDIVFHQADGRIIKWPQTMWKNLCKSAGIKNMRLHDLRHSFASLAINTGASLYEVQHLLGHRSSVTTQRYAHLQAERLTEVSQRVSDALSHHEAE